jgi:hypothetical protein
MTELLLSEAVPLAHAVVDRVARDSAVRILFVKGPIAVAQGLRPTTRDSVDVDVLVDPPALDDLVAALAAAGWDDEQVYATPTAATYSRTLRSARWPCELDLHVRFPGFLAEPREVFERLWARHGTSVLAARELPCLDRTAQALLLAVNALRDPEAADKQHELSDLERRVRDSFAAADITDLAGLAVAVGAAETAAPFLEAVGAGTPATADSDPAQLRAWRMRTQPEWRVATWLEDLRATPLRRWPRHVWYAVMLSETELRNAEPHLPPGRRALLGARLRRIRRGLRGVPGAWRSLRALDRDRPSDPPP